MGVNNTLCQLGSILAEWERDTVTLRSVTVSDEGGTAERKTAEVAVEAPIADADSETAVDCTASVTADETLGVTVETGLSVPESGCIDEFEPVDVGLTEDGMVALTVQFTLADSDGDDDVEGASRTDSVEKVEDGSEVDARESTTGTRDVAPFNDPELLQEVYDTHDTFAEMAGALEMDVTGETVRRYMIDYDIHQPNSYRTESPETTESTAGNDEETVVLSDGLGLPETVEIEDLIETVNGANTIYEVKEDLDMERREAHTMLKELNLVDLVMGRLNSDRSCDITREDVVDRLRETSRSRAA